MLSWNNYISSIRRRFRYIYIFFTNRSWLMSCVNVQERTVWRIRETFRHRWLATRISRSITKLYVNIRENSSWPIKVTVPLTWLHGTAITYRTNTISVGSWSLIPSPLIIAWVNGIRQIYHTRHTHINNNCADLKSNFCELQWNFVPKIMQGKSLTIKYYLQQ